MFLFGLEFVECLFVAEDVVRQFHLRDAGARFGHGGEDLLLLGRVSFDGIDQIRYQVGAPFVLIEDLAPGRLGRFVVGGNVVDAASGE